MSAHDPLCPMSDPNDRDYCGCVLLDRARERIAQEIERYDAEVCDLLGAPCTCAQAARIARGTQ